MNSLRVALLCVALLPVSVTFAASRDQGLLEELRTLTQKSREQRAADRWLQRALDDLVARYDRPWTRTLLFDDFRDGDYTRKPAWKRLEGRFEVQRGRGLVAWDPGPDTVTEAPRHSDNGDTSSSSDPADLGVALVGALLEQALGPASRDTRERQREDDATEPRREPKGPNRLRIKAGTTNAFSLATTLRASSTPVTHLEIALLQDTRGRYGYRLIVETGKRGFIELQRLRRGRAAVVENQALAGRLGDGRLHDLVWQQRPDGTVSLMLDETLLFRVRDHAFRDGYPWLELRHDSGDIEIRSIRVEGTG